MWNALKNQIIDSVAPNGNNEITGQLLQDVLLDIVDELGSHYGLLGIATPTTDPGTQNGNVAYLATTIGVYTNLGEVEIINAGLYLITKTETLWEVTLLKEDIIGGGGASTDVDLAVDATGFNGNLLPTDTNQQLVNKKLDDLPIWIEDLIAWVGTETTLTLTSHNFRNFGTVAVTTAVTVTLTAATSPYLSEYMFKFKHGTGGSFSFTGITIKTPPVWVVGHIYEAHIVRGVLIYNDLSI